MKNKLADLRHERGWTQADLAAAVNVSRQTIISIEGGRFDPSLPLAFALARCFEATVEDLFDPDEHDRVVPEKPAHHHRGSAAVRATSA